VLANAVSYAGLAKRLLWHTAELSAISFQLSAISYQLLASRYISRFPKLKADS
jgi:hypothetical protein